jgi:hypothetical protein
MTYKVPRAMALSGIPLMVLTLVGYQYAEEIAQGVSATVRR